ncbi:class Ib ribonucleoside-diphosphate reductase assembly flavoprotein NrdI [Pseudarthrobacter sp. J75]|uniref:class Ib ribonucleoside-diphosphate reductase assembly flavoprotein NrdI n=1 Tax=unclassified Pseudarthrobacter TaxID=2647000 RepID=UPI002E802098|nr:MULTISPECIES: class Ib ribonucleoside-diphosphate reductase assembly flavoprotein NrdI [unclassified Pseudarthrobacter]MEE2523436.1 class Ib ribonucleoside-diphosphate reductase assembly flavoprotein NrdI [Pseudarthrobacter sp. J47]MEE2529401.1 class Ib ribonucleoside-diphosphate reductase assembly flavoprotein NrdI [Pseudarthrobacter sp. J75]MEE2569282.1 class Ib ribonucleoside-diphosphate reductase assembly flavoprotein NrdI [Pseudarthrobacter sp. J64]
MAGAPAGAQLSAGPEVTESQLIFFTSSSGNTGRFVSKLGRDAAQIPLYPKDAPLLATRPFVLVVPTYGGTGGEGSVPKQVIRFLNNAQNRQLVRGVIGAGNTNFGDNYCMAADIIAAKCGVPRLYRFELMGTPEDVARVNQGLDAFWTRLSQTQK